MIQKDGSVLFNEWQNGQVKHPLYGFGLLQNVEVFENKGIAKLQSRAVLRSSLTATTLPIAEVKDVYGNTYTLTNGNGKLYKNGTVIESGLTNAWDLAIYKDYVWVRSGTVLGAYGPLSGSAQWFANLETGFVSGYNGKLLVGQDDYLYSLNGNYVAKIAVTASGVAGVVPTITTNLTALDLPDGHFGSTMVEYGKNIVIGTHGGLSYSDRSNYQVGRLYAWNRQLGTLGNPGLADLPINFLENGVNAIVQHANKLYVQAGSNGNVYMTDSTNYTKIATLPFAKTGVLSNSTVYANAISISSKGNLLIGLSGGDDEFSKMGVYEIDLSDTVKYPVQFRTISTGSVGTSSIINIGFINQTNYQTISVGWQDGASYGVDDSDFRMYSDYSGVIETPLVVVGTFLEKKAYEHIEFSLAEPIVSGQGVRISYRKNTKSDYTLIGTWDYDFFNNLGVSDVLSFSDNASIVDAEFVQLKIELNQDITTLYGSNVNLISVRLS